MGNSNNLIVLWIQSKNSMDKDILSVNGKRQYRCSDEDYDQYVSMALSVKKEYKLLKRKNNFSIYKISNNTYQILSNFNEVDDVGRRVCFMSYIQTNNDVLTLLQQEAKLYSYTLNKGDKKIIVKNTNRRIYFLRLFMVSIVLILLILIIVLLCY